MMEDALYTISTPNDTMANTVTNRIQSVFSRCAISVSSLQAVDDLFEYLATVFVALELIETGASRRQQHGVAGRRIGVCVRDGGIQGPGIHQRNGALQLVRDLAGG